MVLGPEGDLRIYGCGWGTSQTEAEADEESKDCRTSGWFAQMPFQWCRSVVSIFVSSNSSILVHSDSNIFV